jgi:hypothetical protein
VAKHHVSSNENDTFACWAATGHADAEAQERAEVSSPRFRRSERASSLQPRFRVQIGPRLPSSSSEPLDLVCMVAPELAASQFPSSFLASRRIAAAIERRALSGEIVFLIGCIAAPSPTQACILCHCSIAPASSPQSTLGMPHAPPGSSWLPHACTILFPSLNAPDRPLSFPVRDQPPSLMSPPRPAPLLSQIYTTTTTTTSSVSLSRLPLSH